MDWVRNISPSAEIQDDSTANIIICFTSTVINYLRLEQNLLRRHGYMSTYKRKKKVLSDGAVNYKNDLCHQSTSQQTLISLVAQ